MYDEMEMWGEREREQIAAKITSERDGEKWRERKHGRFREREMIVGCKKDS